MRHLMPGRRLSRTAAHRKAMLRNMAHSLFQHGEIRTTLPKAKELVIFIEPIITLAKKGLANKDQALHARRLVISRLGKAKTHMADPKTEEYLDDTVIDKLFKEIAPAFADRNGGYTRILKTAEWRIGDAGDIVIVQLVGLASSAVVTKKTKKAKKENA